MTTDQQDTKTEGANRRPLFIALAVVAVIAVVGVIALVVYLNQDVPEEVSLESAVEDVTTEQQASSDSGSSSDTTPTTTKAPSTSPAADLDGTWTIDTSIGEFSFEDATSSFVGFRIDEELASIGATQAVGRTPAIDGALEVEGTVLTVATIEADLTQIVTDNSLRDNAVQRALNTATFPTATFVLIEPIDFGPSLEAGDPVDIQAIGELTINGITQPIEIPMEAQLTGEIVVVVGSVNITFADWDVEVPSAPVVVSVEDNGPLEMQLFFVRS